MTKQIDRNETIWMFGNEHAFPIYGSTTALNLGQYRNASGTPERHQKNQIVLHYTAGAGTGEGIINWWNTLATLPNYICSNYFSGHQYGRSTRRVCTQAGCNWTSNNATAVCNVHNQATSQCPSGHAMKKGKGYGSAQYILEKQASQADSSSEFSDCVEVLDSDCVAYHAATLNRNAVGIEVVNYGWGSSGNWGTDNNMRLELPAAQAVRNRRDFQAYEEHQYYALALLLRYLSIKHRIPRRFLGDTTEEKMKRWWHNLPAAEQNETRSKFIRFRGILAHQNEHRSKACGGPALHRNRLFRSIIDEWWLPVDFSGAPRTYYHGPFDPQPNIASFCRFANNSPVLELFRDADLDALQETKSYFELDSVDYYFANVERSIPGGYFPIAKNKCWHGGVHIYPQDANLRVYAAASGTIVAANVQSDNATEQDSDYGSQRFVLIRHAVYIETETDPSGEEGDVRTNFAATPQVLFSLYMHLDAFSDPNSENAENPPWYNLWLRQNPDVDNESGDTNASALITPDIAVSVGDWLGDCGTYANRRVMHFEVIGNVELGVGSLAAALPWADQNLRAEDTSASDITTVASMDNFLSQSVSQTRESFEPLNQVEALRATKLFHLSEWALTSADALATVVSDQSQRDTNWEKIKHFMWLTELLRIKSQSSGNSSPDLSWVDDLCDSQGRTWHYHPFKFMEFINRRIADENREVNESDSTETNVILDNDYLTRFVGYSGAPATAASQAADNQALKPFEVSNNQFRYHFTRSELACNDHVPSQDHTKFHFELLNLIESIRMEYGQGISVVTAHVCEAHNVEAEVSRCVLNGAEALAAHHNGLAVDIKPSGPTAVKCASLWNICESVISDTNNHHRSHAGQPSESDLSTESLEFSLSTIGTIETALADGVALTPEQVNQCVFHIQMGEPERAIVWQAIIVSQTQAQTARLENNTIIGVFSSSAAAVAESETNTPPVQVGLNYEAVIKSSCNANLIQQENNCIKGEYSDRDSADAECSEGHAIPLQRWL